MKTPRAPKRARVRHEPRYSPGMRWAMLGDVWRAALDLLAPLICPLCGDVLVRADACRACGWPSAEHVSRHLEEDDLGPFVVLAGGALTGDLRRLVHAFKYRQDPVALALLAAQARVALPPRLSGWDALAPVPAHPVRRRERGWDAADGLVRRLAHLLGLPVVRPLSRVRYCEPLTGHGRLARRRLLEGTLAARGAWGRLLLVDDVFTTGATFRACRRALLDSGAVSVDLLAGARTPRRTAREHTAGGKDGSRRRL
jgi:predicted amidophosphoribosyltransferase